MEPDKKAQKEKVVLWIGISLLVIVALFAFVTLGIPQIIGQVNNCAPFAEGGNHCGTLGLGMIGIAGLTFFGIPLALTGTMMVFSSVLYSILKRKNIEHPLRTTLLCLIVPIIIALYIIIAFIAFRF